MYWRVRFGRGSFAQIVDIGTIYQTMEFYDPGFYDAKNPKIIDEEKMTFEFDREEHTATPDFVSGGVRSFVCKPEVSNLFGSIFKHECHQYSIEIEGSQYDLHIVNYEEDAVDWNTSDYLEDEDSGDFLYFKKVRLKPTFSTSRNVFRLKGNPDCQLEIFVSDNFKEIYEHNGLTGLKFISGVSIQ